MLYRTIQDIGMPVIALSFLILYAWVIRHSAGDVRHKAIMYVSRYGGVCGGYYFG